MRRFLAENPWLCFFGAAAAAITVVQLVFVNNYIDPRSEAWVNAAQLRLQFAFFVDRGLAVVESWGPGGPERYLSVIWIDLLWPFTYGPAFFLLIRKLDGLSPWAFMPMLEAGSNLIETSLEIYWMANIERAADMPVLFFAHGVVAAIKWLVLVPTYFAHSGLLLWRHGLPGRGTQQAAGR
ncbi:MAG: hypothetical protein RID91_05140 [Azospirillaceae bacterium]